MMVFVEHFLSPGKMAEFDKVFATHLKQVSRAPGFVSLRKLVEPSDTEAKPCVLLEFVGEDLLQAWRESSEHQNIANAYASCWVKPAQVRIFKIEN
ncbi:MAG: antibiotic biosynthesis monooxygenase [Chthoniobacterales bacterium]